MQTWQKHQVNIAHQGVLCWAEMTEHVHPCLVQSPGVGYPGKGRPEAKQLLAIEQSLKEVDRWKLLTARLVTGQ